MNNQSLEWKLSYPKTNKLKSKGCASVTSIRIECIKIILIR